MNTYYRRGNLGLWLRHFRLNSRNPSITSQTTLARKLFLEQKQISKIELGEVEPRIETAAEWCSLTGWREGWDIIAHMYQLHPFAVPPVHPELSERLSDSIINMRQQLMTALESLDEIEKANNKRRPTRELDIDNVFQQQIGDLFDLLPAVKSMMYAAERDIDLNIEEVTQKWTKGSVADQVVMPTMSQLEQKAMA
ncbi:helix-turn-helix domain-containing protein [Natribacillus halophilus]|uniref:helix-turn-helix domain-containing protein n=1 Tax=Natribacillus halophilus TaxID=549003 RepID=UPI00115FFE27|nr:helix-turn-helix transcriptional regulator [Natribacillus halophilus]